MLRLSIALLLAFATLTAHAELFKSVDENGNVTYTDKGGSKTKPVDPPGLTSYSTPNKHKASAPAAQPPAAEEKKPTVYSAVKITAPQPNEALRENSGDVTVKIESTPALDLAAGHKLVVLLDGKATGNAGGGEVKLSNVDRGEHQLVAQIVDAKGKVLKSSAQSSFQLFRATVGRKKGGK